LILGITGASGIHGAARLLVDKVHLACRPGGQPMGQGGCRHRMRRYENHRKTGRPCVFNPDDLYAPRSSGSVPAVGMVVLPCSAHTLAQVAAGLGDSLITRAAHCQLKERRSLILCLREAPLTLIDLENARRATPRPVP
jgi:4-hydroxy-3-polyprenylbenzoate decarboxylase